MNRKKVPVAVALIIEDNKILISKRKSNQNFANYWEFPGGKIESGESGEAAVVREISEELGIKIEVKSLYKKIIYDYGEKIVELYFYLCSKISGEIQCLEVADFKWQEIHKLEAKLFPKANQKLIEYLKHSYTQKL
jgi:8-oxo-dGTP diphosphatase